MQKNIFEIVLDVFKTQDKYVTEDGKLLKTIIYSDVMTMNKNLLTLLLSNEKIKDIFFVKVNDTLIFDKQKFAWFIESKEFLPDSYTRYTNKIGLTHNGEFISKTNDVVLDFPYKDCVLEGGQDKDDQKRNEIFYNEIIASDEINRMLSPKVFTNAKRIHGGGVENNITFNEDDNLIIKGNNLIALSSLLKRYEGKVKCIYIDPPYNTGSDSFNYNDKFNHSTWLVFMKNRLELAKRLLKDDGVIFVQCDDNEQAYLKVLMDDVFGRDNFVNTIAVKMSPSSGVKRRFAKIKFIKNKEFLLLYKKNNIVRINQLHDKVDKLDRHYTNFFNGTNFVTLKEFISKIDNKFSVIPHEFYIQNRQLKEFILENSEYIFRTHRPSKWAIEKLDSKYLIYERKKKNKSRNYVWKVYKDDSDEYELIFDTETGYERLEPLSWKMNENNEITLLRGDFWDVGYEGDIGNINKEGRTNFGSGQKPERLIKDILLASTDINDLVLDFHLGSGTTCAVAHKMGRRYIGIEQMDYIENITVERMKKVIEGEQGGISKAVNWKGGGSFVYCELLEDANTLIEKVQLADETNISEIKELIYLDNRIIPYITKEELKGVDSEFNDLTLEEKKQALIKLIDKNKLYVNYSDMEDSSFNVSENDKNFTSSFYKGV